MDVQINDFNLAKVLSGAWYGGIATGCESGSGKGSGVASSPPAGKKTRASTKKGIISATYIGTRTCFPGGLLELCCASDRVAIQVHICMCAVYCGPNYMRRWIVLRSFEQQRCLRVCVERRGTCNS
jgi:hypothetical protein